MTGQIVKWTIVGILTLGVLLNVASVGKPRKPTTPGVAVGVLVVNALIVLGIVLFWRTS